MTNSSNLEARGTPEWRASLKGEKRHRRDVRPKNPGRMYFTESDRAVLRLLYEYRILSQRQFERLLGRSRGTVQQKLIRLYHHRFVERIFPPIKRGMGRSPTLYVLDKQGYDALREEGIEDFSGFPKRDLSSLFLEHTLAINEVRIAINLACQRLGWGVLEWQGENEIKREYEHVIARERGRKQRSIPILPDSYFVIEIPGRGKSHFFLEVDRGTMPQERYKQKIVGYVAYLNLDIARRRFKAQGLRVLTVTDRPRRFPQLVQTASTVQGIGNRFWFAQLSAISGETVLTESIWRVAGVDASSSLFGSGNL
jgi:hypothetical protein